MPKKIKAAIFTTNPAQVCRVYGEERLKQLAEETDLLPEFVTPENFNTMPVDTIEVGDTVMVVTTHSGFNDILDILA